MTAICGDAQRNLDFYTGLLGLRLVKLTVNFDDPTAYHLYYGDGAGTPGTILTFFPYPQGHPGRTATGMVLLTSLSIPIGSAAYWRERLEEHAVPAEDEGIVDFSDPDGLLLRLIEDEDYNLAAPWERSSVPVEHQIGGMHSVTLQERDIERTATLIMRMLGYDHDEENESPNYWFELGGGGQGKRLEVVISAMPPGRGGPGTVHHVAFRTSDDETQLRLRDGLMEVGATVSEVRDRDYFHSIYFREPGGVLFEIATDPPGFTHDEPLESLGTSLRLPAMHEPRRAEIEAALPPLRLSALG